MTKYILFILGLTVTINSMGQNPLKKEIVGNSYIEYKPASTYKFSNQLGKTVYINTVIDNRSANWNKQINDSTRIDLIKDFWKKTYAEILQDKITEDLSKSNIVISKGATNTDYVITPTIDIHFPNYVVYPGVGYRVLTKINVNVTQNNLTLFTKAYMDYYFFTKGESGYEDKFNTDYMAGTNAAMWIGMQHVLDKFYSDLDMAFANKPVKSEDIPLEVASIQSNIYNDPTLVQKPTDYSAVENKSKIENTDLTKNNYTVTDAPTLPPPSDPKIEGGLTALGIDPVKEAAEAQARKQQEEIARKQQEEAKKKAEAAAASAAALQAQNQAAQAEAAKQQEAINKKTADSLQKVAKELAKQKAIDSAVQAKNELAQKQKAEAASKKEKAAQDAALVKARKDSLQKVNQAVMAKKMEDKRIADSIKKVEVNKKMELAKKQKEEKKKAIGTSQENKTSSPPPVSPQEQAYVKSADNMSEAIKRLAREVELEESRSGRVQFSGNAPTKASQVASKNTMSAERKAQLEAENAARQVRLDSIQKARQQKSQEKAEALAKAQKEREEAKNKVKVTPINPQDYIKDSIEYAQKIQKRNELIAKAQEKAAKQDKEDVIKNPEAQYIYASISTDPPSKVVDNRTAEERKKDRVFTPKNEISKELLSQVAMITPQEESKLMNQFNTQNPAVVDSVVIASQMHKNVKTLGELKSSEETKEKKKDLVNQKLNSLKTPDTSSVKPKDSISTDKPTKSSKNNKNSKSNKSTKTDSKKDAVKDSTALVAPTTTPSATTPPATAPNADSLETGKFKEVTTPSKPTNATKAPEKTTPKPPAKKAPEKSVDQKAGDIEKGIDSKKKEIQEKINKTTN